MNFNTKDFEAKMKKSIEAYESNLATIRGGQANASVLNRITFEYYGSQTPVNTMADIRMADSRTLTVTPYDATTLKAIEKAILTSDLGINPANDGKVIRLVFPQVTEERRKEIKKQIQKMGEDTKVAIRNIRRDANDLIKKMKKDGDLTEDDVKNAEKSVQDITDKYIKDVDVASAKKEKEVMEI
ncbi:MAG: ribosome recycling factor [Clostridia bacterium]|nr:ribosome recycling factor [Clostridia bacterium]